MSFRYDPFERMERMMEQMRRSFTGDESLLGLPEPSWGAADINLSLETDDEGYVVLADIPGFDKSELDLRFDDGVLTIRGEHDVTGEDESGWSHQRRRVHEQVRIPVAVDADDITASYRNGVLEVHLPTEEEVVDRGHRIDID